MKCFTNVNLRISREINNLVDVEDSTISSIKDIPIFASTRDKPVDQWFLNLLDNKNHLKY